jgi:hypothetical protein
MPQLSKLIVGLAAATLLSLAVGTASARNLSLNEQSYRITWTPIELIGGGTIRCNLTLEGTFHYRTLVKSAGALIGQVNRATLNMCTGGSATVLTNALPWHVRYAGFTGTLPNVTGARIDVVGLSINQRYEGLPECLGSSTSESPARLIANVSGGTVTGVRADETARIPLAGGGFCELIRQYSLRGTGAVNFRLRLTLI